MRLVHRDQRLTLWEGEAEKWDELRPVDLMLTNPYGYLPPALAAVPMLIHQWVHRKAEAEAWCRRELTLVSLWNEGREAFWCANMVPPKVDLSDLSPEPGGWYPFSLPVRLLESYPRGITVWDGFMGRGTVGKAALSLGMHYIGVERLAAHMEIAKQYLGLSTEVPHVAA